MEDLKSLEEAYKKVSEYEWKLQKVARMVIESKL